MLGRFAKRPNTVLPETPQHAPKKYSHPDQVKMGIFYGLLGRFEKRPVDSQKTLL